MTTTTRKPYSTDLTNEQWAILEPLIPPAKHGGRPREVDMREARTCRSISTARDASGICCPTTCCRKVRSTGISSNGATTERGGEHGDDGGKKINGRKRHSSWILSGLLLAVVVTSAALDENGAAAAIDDQAVPPALDGPKLRRRRPLPPLVMFSVMPVLR